MAHTDRFPWETTAAGVKDPSPDMHLLIISWTRLEQKDENDMDDNREDINPSLLSPSTVSDVRITALLDPTIPILDALRTKERFDC